MTKRYHIIDIDPNNIYLFDSDTSTVLAKVTSSALLQDLVDAANKYEQYMGVPAGTGDATMNMADSVFAEAAQVDPKPTIKRKTINELPAAGTIFRKILDGLLDADAASPALAANLGLTVGQTSGSLHYLEKRGLVKVVECEPGGMGRARNVYGITDHAFSLYGRSTPDSKTPPAERTLTDQVFHGYIEFGPCSAFALAEEMGLDVKQVSGPTSVLKSKGKLVVVGEEPFGALGQMRSVYDVNIGGR